MSHNKDYKNIRMSNNLQIFDNIERRQIFDILYL